MENLHHSLSLSLSLSVTGLDPLQYNPYTEPLWRAAVSQYNRGMAPVETIIAGKLRTKFHQLEAQPHQVTIPCILLPLHT